MDAWWTSMGLALQIFYAIALATTMLLVLQLALLLVGVDHDGDAGDMPDDGDPSHGHGGGAVFSIRSVTAFFTGFGWTGVAAIQAGWPVVAATLAALAVGALFMAGILALMRGLMGLRSSGTLNYHNAIGNVGTVYVTVPAAMKGPGRVEVLIQGRLAVVEAFTHAARPLATRERVRVVGLLDETTLVIEPFAEDPSKEQ